MAVHVTTLCLVKAPLARATDRRKFALCPRPPGFVKSALPFGFGDALQIATRLGLVTRRADRRPVFGTVVAPQTERNNMIKFYLAEFGAAREASVILRLQNRPL
jgi:hypothetical protein